MGGHCKLCGNPVGSTRDSVRCRCGQRLHVDCQADHEETCPNTSREGWVDAQEF